MLLTVSYCFIVDSNYNGYLYLVLMLVSQIIFICARHDQDRDVVVGGVCFGLKLETALLTGQSTVAVV
jgi:hypothetical protein